MTQSETLAVLSDFGENTATYLAMYISVTFAYLTVAYFVGASLSRFQCLAISSFYVVSALVTGATTVGWANAFLILKADEETMLNQVWLFDKLGIFPGLISVVVGVCLLSLYFMYDVRRIGEKNAA